MQTVDELGAVTYTHHYVSFKRLTWLTTAITATMGLLYFVVGFPPAFDTLSEKMYFHSIGIGLAALAAYLIIVTFDLERHEPPLDFPLSYRAFAAVLFAALGGLVLLSPTVASALPHVSMLLFICAFLLIFDVGGALLIELLVLPRKLAGTYRSESHNPVQYFARLVPLTRADLRAYRRRGLGYWLTLVSVASFFFAEIIGFVNLWVMELGPSIFGRYMAWLGLRKKGFLELTLDPHSHIIAIAIMAGIVGVAAVRFRLAEPGSRVRRWIANTGLGLTLAGIIGTTVILGLVAFFNYEPPTLFVSGPDGISGMPGDDAVMAVVLIGAMVLSAALLVDANKRRDGIKLLFVATWVGAVLINLAEGFYIELHEDVFQGSALAKDVAFSTVQPMAGIFLLTAIALGLLLLDYYPIVGRMRRASIWTFGIGLAAVVLGSTVWTFTDPTKYGGAFWIYIAGTVVSFLAILLTGLWIARARIGQHQRVVPEVEEPLTILTEARMSPTEAATRSEVGVGAEPRGEGT